DPLGRLTCLGPTGTTMASCTNPAGEAPTAISYDSLNQTTVTRNGSDGNSSLQQYLYDGFGRLIREVREKPSGFSTRKRADNAAGQAYFTSEWAPCSSLSACATQAITQGTTSSTFDPFGRPQMITRADGTRTCISYASGTVTVSCGSQSANFSDSQKSVQ